MSDSPGMGRPKTHSLPENCTFDSGARRYVVRNPITGVRKTFAEVAKSAAVKTANKLNAWVTAQRQLQALEAGRPTIAALVTKWINDRLQFMPWAPSTRKNYIAKMNRIAREDIGRRTIAHTDCMFLEDWIAGFAERPDTFNDWRYVFVLLWDFAVSRHMASVNEAAKIQERSTSKKLEVNQKIRTQLETQGFCAIHRVAPGWGKLAMEQSLVTLQGRSEICNMRLDDYRSGFLFVIRNKTARDSEMAFIKIALTPELDSIRKRAIALDGIASPYLIHRRPDSMRRTHIDGKPHWTYVTPDYLTGEFAKWRDETGLFDHLKPRERPTFHEVRGLGARIYEARGVRKADIAALMTHSDVDTTEIYLEKGAAALSDENYIAVSAPLTLRDMLGAHALAVTM